MHIWVNILFKNEDEEEMSLHVIQSGNSFLEFDTHGAYIRSLSLSGAEILMKSSDGHQTHGGCAALIPYANRVRNASYLWCGKRYSLPRNNGDHSIHGFAKDQNWTVEISGNKATLTTELSASGYPSRVKCSIVMEIFAERLSVGMGFLNEGEIKAPLSPGFHPYFLFKDRWQITPVKEPMMLEYEDSFFPTGELIPFDPMELSSDSGRIFDNCFRMGQSIKLNLGHLSLNLRNENMPYFVVYNGKYSGGVSVAVEPMVGAPDAFNNGMGLITLDPGNQFHCGFQISTLP